MMHGIEGLIYRSDFEAAFDVGKRLAERYLANGTIGVEVLMDNPSWSIYAPSRTKDVDIADANVYFNNLGELFINRPLRAGDWYTLDIDRLTVGELEIEQALADCEGADDPAYAAALVLNRDLPLGIDSALYQQTYEDYCRGGNAVSARFRHLRLAEAAPGNTRLRRSPCRRDATWCPILCWKRRRGIACISRRPWRLWRALPGFRRAMWRAIWPFRTKTVNAS